MAFTNSSKKNGGVFYLRNHKVGLINHELSYQAEVLKKFQTRLLKLWLIKNFPTLKPGDCIIHHCEVAHGSKKTYPILTELGL